MACLNQVIKLILSLIFIQLINSGGYFLSSISSQAIIDIRVHIGYRYLVAAVVVIPIAYFKERTMRPPMTWSIFLYGCSCGLLGGSLAQNLNASSLWLTWGANWSAISNLLPAVTFILALIFRLEVLDLHTWVGRAKVGGMILSMGGAIVIIFFMGLRIPITPRTSFMFHKENQMNPNRHNPLIGALLALASCVSLASSLLIQSRLVGMYPIYSSMGLTTGSAAVVSILYAVVRTTRWDAWNLYPPITLLANGYMGGLVYGLVEILLLWCIRIRGPVFVAAFSPLSFLFLSFIGPLVLSEELHLGSILGGVLIFVGISMVLLGMQVEYRRSRQSPESQERQPDLESGVVEASPSSELPARSTRSRTRAYPSAPASPVAGFGLDEDIAPPVTFEASRRLIRRAAAARPINIGTSNSAPVTDPAITSTAPLSEDIYVSEPMSTAEPAADQDAAPTEVPTAAEGDVGGDDSIIDPIEDPTDVEPAENHEGDHVVVSSTEVAVLRAEIESLRTQSDTMRYQLQITSDELVQAGDRIAFQDGELASLRVELAGKGRLDPTSSSSSYRPFILTPGFRPASTRLGSSDFPGFMTPQRAFSHPSTSQPPVPGSVPVSVPSTFFARPADLPASSSAPAHVVDSQVPASSFALVQVLVSSSAPVLATDTQVPATAPVTEGDVPDIQEDKVESAGES